MSTKPNDPIFLLVEMLRALDNEADVAGDDGSQPNDAMRFQMLGGSGQCDDWADRAKQWLKSQGVDWKTWEHGRRWTPQFGWNTRVPVESKAKD